MRSSSAASCARMASTGRSRRCWSRTSSASWASPASRLRYEGPQRRLRGVLPDRRRVRPADRRLPRPEDRGHVPAARRPGEPAAVRGRDAAVPAQGGEDPAGAAGVARALVPLAGRRAPRAPVLRDVALGGLPAARARPAGGRAGDGARAGGPHALVLLVQAAAPRPGAPSGAARPPLRAAWEPVGRRAAARALGAALQLAEPRAALRLPRHVGAGVLGRPVRRTPSSGASGCETSSGASTPSASRTGSPSTSRYSGSATAGRPSSRGARSTPRARPRRSPPSSARRSSPTTGSTRSCTSWHRGRSRNRRGRVERDPLDAELYELARQAQLRREELEQPTRDDTDVARIA